MGQRLNAGRVLSARNESRIRDAQVSLAAVLSELGEEQESNEEGTAAMTKPVINLAGLPERAMNLAPRALGPGHLRLAADEGEAPKLFVYGDIGGYWDGGVNAEDTVRELAALDADELHVHINSPGGSVFDGVSIYNALATHKAKIIVHVDGIAASIASVIAMAGDEIRIAEGANFMIHAPWTILAGNAKALRKEADVLDTLEAGLIDIYVARTGGDRAEIASWVDAETWFRGQDAVDKGFADTMVPAKKKEKKAALTHARSAMLPFFKNTPQDLVPAGDDDGTPEVRILERQLRDAVGLSAAEAKCVIALAKAALHTGPRDESREPAAAAPAAPAAPARDEQSATELANLKAHILSLISK
jgi:ATP-dependent protease ClpP protease subunit